MKRFTICVINAGVIQFAFLFWSFNIVRVEQKPVLPNVILILMDDLGYGDLKCYGSFPYHTPKINKLAASGMRFTNFYAAQATCSASRSAILTGCYPNRIGISGAFSPDNKIALNPGEETIAKLLKDRGYKTGMIGKWHLGQKVPFLPLSYGFDEFLGLPYSHDY
jgi:arylsulfatase